MTQDRPLETTVVAVSALKLAFVASCEVAPLTWDPSTSWLSQALWVLMDPSLIDLERVWAAPFPVESCGDCPSSTWPHTHHDYKYRQRGMEIESELEPRKLGLSTEPMCEFPKEVGALPACVPRGQHSHSCALGLKDGGSVYEMSAEAQ